MEGICVETCLIIFWGEEGPGEVSHQPLSSHVLRFVEVSIIVVSSDGWLTL